MIYYFLVGGGDSNSSTNGLCGNSGKILLGTTTIATASSDLTLTIGVGNNTYAAGTESTISGGLTLTSGNGASIYGFYDPNFTNANVSWSDMGKGINYYGAYGGSYQGTVLTGGPKARKLS